MALKPWYKIDGLTVLFIGVKEIGGSLPNLTEGGDWEPIQAPWLDPKFWRSKPRIKPESGLED